MRKFSSHCHQRPSKRGCSDLTMDTQTRQHVHSLPAMNENPSPAPDSSLRLCKLFPPLQAWAPPRRLAPGTVPCPVLTPGLQVTHAPRSETPSQPRPYLTMKPEPSRGPGPVTSLSGPLAGGLQNSRGHTPRQTSPHWALSPFSCCETSPQAEHQITELLSLSAGFTNTTENLQLFRHSNSSILKN